MQRVGHFIALGCGLLLRTPPSDALCLGLPHDYTWPSPDCFNGLQACIDSEPCNGGTVEIATNPDQPITDPISFQKGLTLRAYPGYHPVFTAPLSAATPTDSNVRVGYDIRIEGLTFEGAGIQVLQNSPSTLSVAVAGNTLTSNLAIEVGDGSGGSGAVDFDVSGNTIAVSNGPVYPGGDGIYIHAADASGKIANNSIAIQPGVPFGDEIVFSGIGVSGVDVIANHVSTASNGIGIDVSPASSSDVVTARILDNLVTGEPTDTGGAAIDLRGGEATLLATVVNNTIVGNGDGIDASGQGLSGLVANNIVSRNTGSGISIDSALAATLANRNNIVFGNGSNSFTPGPVTIAADPLFVGPGDSHLQGGSPALDAGDDSAVPGDLATDLDGRPRILGSHVDFGAYETGPLVWPERAPCDATLQACVDAAADGDTVSIHSNGPIDESISFQKSLTLRAGSGYTPVFADGRSINASTPATGAKSITIEGLTLLRGTISVIQESVGSLNAMIVGNTTLNAQEVGINLNFIFSGTGDVTFDISDNTVGVPAYRDDDFGIGAVFNGNATGRIANNSIVMGEASNGYAIDLYDTAGSLDVDVIANHLSGTNYDTGIGVVAGESGAAHVRILDNLVTGQGGNAGLAGAIALEADAPGPFTATVVNNTVTDGEIGIAARGNLMTGLVANNIVTTNTRWGIRIDPPDLANSNNLVFGNATDPFTPGPGTVTLDPLFVGASDFLLQPSSPAIDAGDDASVPADLTTDLDGNPRIQGSHIDIGAYETAPEPTAEVLAVTVLAVLVGLRLAVAASLGP